MSEVSLQTTAACLATPPDYAGAVELLVMFYAENVSHCHALLEAASVFSKRYTLTVDIDQQQGGMKSIPIETLFRDRAHTISGSAAMLQINLLVGVTSEIQDHFHAQVVHLEGQHDNKPIDDDTRRSYIAKLINRGTFVDLYNKFRQFTEYVEGRLWTEAQQYISKEQITQALRNSAPINGHSLEEWSHHINTSHFEQVMKDIVPVPHTVTIPNTTPKSANGSTNISKPLAKSYPDGDAILKSIPDDAVCDDEDETYGIPGWQFPPRRPEENRIVNTIVDKYPDAGALDRAKELNGPEAAPEMLELIICLVEDAVDRLKSIFKAASAYREHGKLSMEYFGQTRAIECILKDDAHALKGSAANLHLNKLWKIARLVELPNKEFWSKPDESEEARRQFLQRFTHGKNLLFLWIQVRNLIPYLHSDQIVKELGMSIEEACAEMGDNMDGIDSDGISFLDKYNRLSVQEFDSQFKDICIFNPFDASYIPEDQTDPLPSTSAIPQNNTTAQPTSQPVTSNHQHTNTNATGFNASNKPNRTIDATSSTSGDLRKSTTNQSTGHSGPDTYPRQRPQLKTVQNGSGGCGGCKCSIQ